VKSVRIIGTPLASDGAAALLPYRVELSVGGESVQLFGRLPYGGTAFDQTVAVIPDDATAALVTPDVRLELVLGAAE